MFQGVPGYLQCVCEHTCSVSQSYSWSSQSPLRFLLSLLTFAKHPCSQFIQQHLELQSILPSTHRTGADDTIYFPVLSCFALALQQQHQAVLFSCSAVTHTGFRFNVRSLSGTRFIILPSSRACMPLAPKQEILFHSCLL